MRAVCGLCDGGGVQKNWNTISDIMEYQINQKWAIKDINQEILNVKADVLKSKEVADRHFKILVWMLVVLMVISITGAIL